MKKIRRQPRIPGMRRLRLSPYVPKELWKAVANDAREFNTSMSAVVAIALCDAMGIDLDKKMRLDIPSYRGGRR